MTKKIKPIEGEVTRRKKHNKYESWMSDKIIDIASQGGHVEDMLIALNISRDTFYRWKKEIPEFEDAIKESTEHAKQFYGQVLLAGGLGKIKGFNFNAIAMILNNKFPDEYKRSANGSNTEININSVHYADKLDLTQIEERLVAVRKQLGQNGQGNGTEAEVRRTEVTRTESEEA